MNRCFYIITFFTLVLVGCGIYTPNRIKRSFTYCFDGNKTGIESMLNIDGVYYIKNEKTEKVQLDITTSGYFQPCFVFYDRGFVHDNAFLIANKKRNYFDERYGARFGSYILCNDTIKLQYVSSPYAMMQGSAEVWFKIVDKEHIRILYWGEPGLGCQKTIDEYSKYGYYKGAIFEFYPYKNKINPEKAWLYQKRWFRCKEM